MFSSQLILFYFQAFSNGYWRDFCLAHLFTYQDFPNGVIGVAYVGSPRLIGLGGICSIGMLRQDQFNIMIVVFPKVLLENERRFAKEDIGLVRCASQ